MSHRLFVAIPIPKSLTEALYLEAQAICNDSHWETTPAENLHLTLSFLGNVSGEQLSALKTELEQLEKHGSFEVAFDRIAPFIDAKSRILASLPSNNEGIEPLKDLNASMRRISCKLGIKTKTNSDFKPHITLARLPQRYPPHQQSETRLNTVLSVKEVCLYRSCVQTTPPRYEILATYPLIT